MRIPVDYYRILGVPTQASIEQLQGAYQDRSKQLPRKEYSSQAIAARRQLLDEAYQILSDPTAKAEYDKQFFLVVPNDSSLTMTDQEGINENVIELDQSPYLEIQLEQLSGALVILQELAEYEQVISFGESFLKTNSLPLPEQTDIFLSIALAELELSREQWQQKNYEQAAFHGQKGLKLLEDHQVLPTIGLEIETELAKLVPYRILKIFSTSNSQSQERSQGIELLQQLLQARQGIEGKGHDHSGLNLENFLRFIQQLRPLLTSQEQKILFESEAKRPSSVGLYLLVYTLIAQGFGQKKPDLINEAQKKLENIAQKQNVIIEQSICALLLGQTESALERLKNCQDQELVQLLRRHSTNAGDLLPGLCWYAEHWLKFEVLAHFQDFLDARVSLNEYFLDQTVQEAIERITDGAPKEPTFSQENLTIKNTMLPQKNLTNNGPETRRRPSRSTSLSSLANEEEKKSKPQQIPRGETTIATSAREGPTSPIATRIPGKRRRRKQTSIRLGRLLLVVAVMGLGVSSFVVAWVNLSKILFKNKAIPGLEGEQLSLSITKSPITIPLAPIKPKPSNDSLTKEESKMLLENWLKIKSEAFGQKHDLTGLNRVLAQPALGIFQKQAEDIKEEGTYETFEHQITIESVKTMSQETKQAQINAQVQEKASYYQEGKINQNKSYQDDLLVQYDLKKEGDSWLIYNIHILNK